MRPRCTLGDTAEQAAAMVIDAPAKPPVAINFRDLFLSQEDDDEESSSVSEALAAMSEKWPKSEAFQAADLARLLNERSEYKVDADRERTTILREFLFPTVPPNQDVSAKSASKMLKRHVGEPVKAGDRTLILRAGEDPHSKIANFHVLVKT